MLGPKNVLPVIVSSELVSSFYEEHFNLSTEEVGEKGLERQKDCQIDYF